MPFEEGNKLATGGAREGAGAPTNEERKARKAFEARFWKRLEARHERIIEKYLSSKDYKDIVNRVIPYAKAPEEAINPRHVIDRTAILAIIATPNAQEAVEKLTEAIAGKLSNEKP